MNLNKILLSALVSTTLAAPLMATDPMDVVPSSANQGQGQPRAQQPVIFHKADGSTFDAATRVYKHQQLLVHKEGLTGTIPEAIGSLDGLKFLILPRNNLSGALPHEIGNLTKLEQLHLQCNNFSGIFPPEILSSLNVLKFLNISDNQFTSFDGSLMTSRDASFSLLENPLTTFISNPNLEYCLQNHSYSGRSQNIHIHFDGEVIANEEELINLRGALQPNIRPYETNTDIIRIAFYKGNDPQNPHPISKYLQSLGVTHDTVIMKDEHGNITVEGLLEGFEAQPFINLLENVRDMPERRFGRMKSAQK